MQEESAGCARNALCGSDGEGGGQCLCNSGFVGDPYGEECTGTVFANLNFTSRSRLKVRVNSYSSLMSISL